MAEKTIGDLQEQQNKNKGPLSGYSTGGTPGVGIYNPATGQQVATTGQSITYTAPKATDSEARIGDYVLQGGTAVVAPNSQTDLEQRYLTVVGGTERPTASISTVAGGAASGAVMGSTLLPIASSITPVGKMIGGVAGAVAGALNAFNESQGQALEEWKKQKVNVENAVEFYRDDKGALRAKIDYEKAEKGGVLSGEGVKGIQNAQTTVGLGDDGHLKVTTSPAFAGTNLYKSLVEDISARYAGLSKEDDDYGEKIEEIRSLISGWADRYRYEMNSYADYKQRFKDADDNSIMAGYETELGGYVDPEKMGEYQMSIISEDGKIETSSAKDLFDSVLGMDKDERNKFIGNLTEIIFGDSDKYSDSERAVAYGELKALRAVSANAGKAEDNKYQKMLDADFAVTLIDNFRPLGLNVGDVVNFVSGGQLMKSSQEYLDQNELAKTIGLVSGPAVGAGILRGATRLNENILKNLPGVSKLFEASLEGTAGGAIAFLAQNADDTVAVAKATAASFAFEVMKDAIFDAALAGTQTLVSNEDFLSTFGEDFRRDIIVDLAFQYYDAVKFAKATTDTKVYVYRGEDGAIRTLKTDTESLYEDGQLFENVGSINATVTPAGNVIAVETDDAGSTVMVDGKVVRIDKVEEAPAFKDGVVETETPGSRDEIIARALKKAGLPEDTPVFTVSARDAESAEAARKVSGVDTSKVGLTLNKHLFSKNAGLDAANNIAFAKDADRKAWQDANETFANNLELAKSFKDDIQNGKWIKSTATTWNNYIMKQGEFQSSFGKMTKADFNYLNAKESIERAKLANAEKTDGDPRDYEQEALDKNGKYLALPEDRARALDDFQEARKAYLADFNRSVSRSGYVDRDLINAATESSLQENVGWVPLWGKNQDPTTLLDSFYGISQTRKPIKSWIREGDVVDAADLENPLIADERYTQQFATNMALNYRNLVVSQRLAAAGLLVDNSPSPETERERKLDSIKNKDELKKKLDDMIADTEKNVKENSLNAGEYTEMMMGLYEKYKIDSSVQKATSLPGEITEENWKEVWGDMGREEKAMLRDELAKTAQRTGYGVSDTRARLNSMVPGFDVLDWSLLGRDHTDGLVPGGLYSHRNGYNEVEAYIMSIGQLKKLLGISGNAPEDAKAVLGHRLLRHINTEGGNAPIPVTLSGNPVSDSREFYFSPRGGNSLGVSVPLLSHFHGYLEELEAQGVQDVPVVISGRNGGPLLAGRSRGPSLGEVVRGKLGELPQNITDDLRQAFVEYGRIPFYRGQTGLGQFNMNDTAAVVMGSNAVGDAYWIAPNASYTDSYGPDKIMGTIPVKYFMSDKEKNDLILEMEKRHWELYDKGYDNLSKKEKKEYDGIIEVIEPRPYKEGSPYPRYGEDSGPEIMSYRALAEYAKKPVIDISDDGFANGTAFFYYKDVSPEFDKEVGDQLLLQATFDRRYPQWDEDSIADRMEIYDGMSIADMIDCITNGRGFGEEWDEMLEGFAEGEVSSSELSDEFVPRVAGKSKRYPGITRVMRMVWDDVPLQDLRDMKFRYWDPSTGYPTINVSVAGAFLDDMMESRPGVTDETPPEGQKNLFDLVRPTAENIPSTFKFAQPRSVSYEDYEAWKNVDPELEPKFLAALKKSRLDSLTEKTRRMLRASNNYLRSFGISTDVNDYVRTSLRPDLERAVQSNDEALVAARIGEAMTEVTPFIDPDYLKKQQLDATAERWREWAEKNVKGGRANTKQLRSFVESNMLTLPDRKGNYAGKVKHALWEKVKNGELLPAIEGLDASAVSSSMDKQEFYRMLDETPLLQSAVRDKRGLVDLVSAEINGETTDAYKMGTAKKASGMGGRYPISFYIKGRPYTRFITYRNEAEQRLAEEIVSELNDKELLVRSGLFSKLAKGVSNTFMNLTTALDPTRVGPNVARDTVRGEVLSGGESYINAGKVFKSVLELGNYSKSQKEELERALDLAVKKASRDTYNSQFKNPKNIQTQLAEEYQDRSGAGPVTKFIYRFAHDKASLLAAPSDFFESFTRHRLAKASAANALRRAQIEGKDFKAQMEDMVSAANFAGHEYTANFARKGETIGRLSKYVSYLGSAYAGVDSLKRAYINNPKGITHAFSGFLAAYLILLADTLSDEESRKQYHRLSEYDRAHSVVVSLGDNSILTIPLDEQLASFVYPYRRILETLNGTDPVSFWEFAWGTITEPLPMDLSGFSEGDTFNLQRGLEKIAEQHAPRILTSGLEVYTGRDLYYGSTNEVTQETLQDMGVYDPTPGDYTTAGKNSATLRAVADATGIPQWQLQSIVSNFGGNVGSYVLNTIDRLSGASEDAQGGKDFVNAVFKSFVATDSDNAANQFYEGLQLLKEEKRKVLQKIYNNNEKSKTATGQDLIKIQQDTEKTKQEYATKVADFVGQYLNAYEITGGLTKSQANQIFYLFVLGDNDTPYESGSLSEYYGSQADTQLRNEAQRLAAPILDKYYDRSKTGIYQDTDGNWRVYAPYGQQAYLNTFYGQGTKYEVDLRNILEGKENSLKGAKTAVSAQRTAALQSEDWDEYNKLAADWDKKVIEAIAPYVQKYGAENVLTNTKALDYLEDWFYVPDSFIRTKNNRYVSLAHNASTQKAFVRPYIKYLFGLDTNATNYREVELENSKVGEFIK